MEAKRIEKQYDFTELNKFFNRFITPEQLMEELVELAFDYASKVDEGETELFRSNIGTIYIIYSELKNLK